MLFGERRREKSPERERAHAAAREKPLEKTTKEEKRCELCTPREGPRPAPFKFLSSKCTTRRARLSFGARKRTKRRAQGGGIGALNRVPALDSARKEKTRRRVQESKKRERAEREKKNQFARISPSFFLEPTQTRHRLDAQRAQLEAQRSTPW